MKPALGAPGELCDALDNAGGQRPVLEMPHHPVLQHDALEIHAAPFSGQREKFLAG